MNRTYYISTKSIISKSENSLKFLKPKISPLGRIIWAMEDHPEFDKHPVALRPVRPEDIKYFSQWWRDPDLIQATSGDTVELTDDQIEDYFKAILESQNALHFMVEHNGSTIGHVSLQKRDGSWWETQIVLGDKASQGKGFGAQAIEQLLDKAKTQGIGHIYLEVRPENTRAISTYEKAGFRQVGEALETGNELQPQLIRMELYQQLEPGA